MFILNLVFGILVVINSFVFTEAREYKIIFFRIRFNNYPYIYSNNKFLMCFHFHMISTHLRLRCHHKEHQCTSVFNEEGQCVRLRQCHYLNQYFENNIYPVRRAIIQHVIKYKCGYDYSVSKSTNYILIFILWNFHFEFNSSYISSFSHSHHNYNVIMETKANGIFLRLFSHMLYAHASS